MTEPVITASERLQFDWVLNEDQRAMKALLREKYPNGEMILKIRNLRRDYSLEFTEALERLYAESI